MISPPRSLLVIGAVAFIAACAQLSPPTRYYALSSLSPTEQTARPLVIGVGPVAMADYLDRPQIVTRSTAMELQLHDFEMWVESLETIFPRALGENLSSLLGTDRVVLMPAPREVHPDYQVEVDVLRFDAMRPGEVMLDAGWRLYGRDGERLIKDGRSRIVKPVVDAADQTEGVLPDTGAETPDIVAAMSEATVELSRQIAAVITAARR